MLGGVLFPFVGTDALFYPATLTLIVAACYIGYAHHARLRETSPPAPMTLLYFAQARRISGLASEALPATAPLTADQLWHEILQRHPDLAVLHPVIRLARNGEFASADTLFQPGDEIALIPPVSGG